eukprot:g1063.t1
MLLLLMSALATILPSSRALSFAVPPSILSPSRSSPRRLAGRNSSVTVDDGECRVSDGVCVLSPSGDQSGREYCVATVTGAGRIFIVDGMQIVPGHDAITVRGETHTGTGSTLAGIEVTEGDKIVWESDGTQKTSGFGVCILNDCANTDGTLENGMICVCASGAAAKGDSCSQANNGVCEESGLWKGDEAPACYTGTDSTDCGRNVCEITPANQRFCYKAGHGESNAVCSGISGALATVGALTAPACPHGDGITANSAQCTCAATGYEPIADVDACRMAAFLRGWDAAESAVRSISELDLDGDAKSAFYGCFQSAKSGGITFRKKEDDVMQTDALPCDTAANTAACACGQTAECSVVTGLYCHGEADVCTADPLRACENTNQSAPNPTKCMCKKQVCDSDTTGLWCTISKLKPDGYCGIGRYQDCLPLQTDAEKANQQDLNQDMHPETQSSFEKCNCEKSRLMSSNEGALLSNASVKKLATYDFCESCDVSPGLTLSHGPCICTLRRKMSSIDPKWVDIEDDDSIKVCTEETGLICNRRYTGINENTGEYDAPCLKSACYPLSLQMVADMKANQNGPGIQVQARGARKNTPTTQADSRPAHSSGTSDQAGRRYGIYIGIDKYTDPSWPNLAGCKHDAESVERKLREDHGFQTLPNAGKVLTNSNATRKNIVDLFEQVAKTILPEDRLLVFMAGHGDSKCGFLCSDWNETTGKTGSISFPSLYETLIKNTGMSSNHLLFVIDACHSGRAKVKEAEVEYGCAPGPTPCYQMLAACKGDESAIESNGGLRPAGGNFTRFFLEAVDATGSEEGIAFKREECYDPEAAVNDACALSADLPWACAQPQCSRDGNPAGGTFCSFCGARRLMKNDSSAAASLQEPVVPTDNAADVYGGNLMEDGVRSWRESGLTAITLEYWHEYLGGYRYHCILDILAAAPGDIGLPLETVCRAAVGYQTKYVVSLIIAGAFSIYVCRDIAVHSKERDAGEAAVQGGSTSGHASSAFTPLIPNLQAELDQMTRLKKLALLPAILLVLLANALVSGTNATRMQSIEQPFTLEMWFYASTSTPADRFLLVMNCAYGIKWMGSGQPLSFYDTDYSSGSQTMTAGKWWHVAMVATSTSLTAHYNGGESTDSLTRHSIHGTSGCAANHGITLGGYISQPGANPSMQFTGGRLADVRLWNRARTRDEIRGHFQVDIDAVALHASHGLIGRWAFRDEASKGTDETGTSTSATIIGSSAVEQAGATDLQRFININISSLTSTTTSAWVNFTGAATTPVNISAAACNTDGCSTYAIWDSTGLPEAPSWMDVRVHNETALAVFLRPPKEDGGSDISYYNITSNSSGGTDSDSGSSGSSGNLCPLFSRYRLYITANGGANYAVDGCGDGGPTFSLAGDEGCPSAIWSTYQVGPHLPCWLAYDFAQDTRISSYKVCSTTNPVVSITASLDLIMTAEEELSLRIEYPEDDGGDDVEYYEVTVMRELENTMRELENTEPGAHRYFRVKTVQTNFGDRRWTLSGLAFQVEDCNGGVTTPSGRLMANSACTHGGCGGNAVDGNKYVLSSAYKSPTGGAYPVVGHWSFYYSSNDWIGVDLGAGSPAAVTRLAFKQDSGAHTSQEFFIQYSDDFNEWVNVYHAENACMSEIGSGNCGDPVYADIGDLVDIFDPQPAPNITQVPASYDLNVEFHIPLHRGSNTPVRPSNTTYQIEERRFFAGNILSSEVFNHTQSVYADIIMVQQTQKWGAPYTYSFRVANFFRPFGARSPWSEWSAEITTAQAVVAPNLDGASGELDAILQIDTELGFRFRGDAAWPGALISNFSLQWRSKAACGVTTFDGPILDWETNPHCESCEFLMPSGLYQEALPMSEVDLIIPDHNLQPDTEYHVRAAAIVVLHDGSTKKSSYSQTVKAMTRPASQLQNVSQLLGDDVLCDKNKSLGVPCRTILGAISAHPHEAFQFQVDPGVYNLSEALRFPNKRMQMFAKTLVTAEVNVATVTTVRCQGRCCVDIAISSEEEDATNARRRRLLRSPIFAPERLQGLRFVRAAPTSSASGSAIEIRNVMTDITIDNCSFVGFIALASGGAISIGPTKSAITLSRVAFESNTAEGKNGGGALHIDSATNVLVDGATFRGNVGKA